MNSMSTGIEELATNNRMPSEGEIQEVKRLLTKPTQDLEDIDPEILDLTNRLSELQSKRNETEKQISRLNSLLSPIRRVPQDVLGDIFYQCLPTQRNPIMKFTECPLLLTHVCSLWRAVAMTSPRLWERLYITFTDDDTLPDIDAAAEMVRNGEFTFVEWQHAPSKAEKERRIQSLRRRYDAIKEWILRSGTRPLSISLLFTSRYWYTVPYSERPTSVTMELLSFLATLSSRILDLELNTPAQIYEALAQLVRVSEMTALTSLRVDYHAGAYDETVQSRPISSFFQAPKLRQLSFLGGDAKTWGLRDPSFKMQWAKLTTLTCMDSLTIDETLFILENSPNLVHYKGVIAEYVANDTQPFFYEGNISLPVLRTFSITEYVKPQRLGNIYDRIDAPLLRSIAYDSHALGPNDQDSAVVPITILPLLRKSINLQKLLINTRNFTDRDLGALLVVVPTITHLVLGPTERRRQYTKPTRPMQLDYDPMGVPRDQSWSFRRLVVDHQSQNTDLPLLPHLTSLTISSPSLRIDPDIIFDIVKSRMLPTITTAALDHVKVTFFTEKTRDIAQELTSYAESLGIKINLGLEYLPQSPPEKNPIHPGHGVNLTTGRTWAYIDAGEDSDV